MKKKLLENIFSQISDPRVTGRCDHLLEDILFIAFCTLLSNGEDFADMVEFGKEREKWLRKFLRLPNGIPSHDTFNRVLQIIDPKELSAVLSADGQRLVDGVAGKLINLDGKKIRGENPTSRGNTGLYILSAWVGEDRLCIGQSKVQDKSNEITAIPDVLDSIDITGSTVSIDAIGCQVEIAAKIVERKAAYLLSVKANQKRLFECCEDAFTWGSAVHSDEQWEYDHGRYEIRTCQVVRAQEVLDPMIWIKWKGIQSLIKVESKRRIGEHWQEQTRYYISSETKSSTQYNEMVRGHWSIENQLHWHLDVTFKEDACRSRTGFAPENLNILRKTALHRLATKKAKAKASLKKMRFRASLNTQFLEDLIFF